MLLYPVWLGLLLTSLAGLIRYFTRLRISSILILVWFIAAPFVGAYAGAVRDSVFRSRLPEYQAAVEAVRAGNMPKVISRLAYDITAHAGTTGDAEVFFF
jgi:hypothetical protein